MLIIDGVRYTPWTPKDEEKEFHPLVKAQSKEIFGKDSIYFDVKTTLKSASGIGSIPDAYVINLAEPSEWYVVENELATHPVYDHIVKQLSKFINGIDNKENRNQILELLYNKINSDRALKAEVLAKTKSDELHRYLSKLLLKTPKIVVIIDEKTLDIEDACHALRYTPYIVEFRTFEQENNPRSHAHLFETICSELKTSTEKMNDRQDIEQIIEGMKPQKEFELVFRKFFQEIEKLSNEISIEMGKKRILFKTKIPFVAVELCKGQIVLHLTLSTRPEEKNFGYIRKVYGNRWHAHLVVRNLSEAEPAMEICKKAFEDSLR